MKFSLRKAVLLLICGILVVLIFSACASGSEKKNDSTEKPEMSSKADATEISKETEGPGTDPVETPELIFFDPQKLYD